MTTKRGGGGRGIKRHDRRRLVRAPIISVPLSFTLLYSRAALRTCPESVPEPVVGYRGTIEHPPMGIVGTVGRSKRIKRRTGQDRVG